MTVKTWRSREMEVVSVVKEKNIGSKEVRMWFRCWSSREKHSLKYLLESEERGIKTSEFFKGRKASTFSARRTSLNNICIGESLFFSFRTF
jgi:hypothetical protein